MSDKKVSNNKQNSGLNLCNRCKHGIFSRWGHSDTYDHYVSCPYSSHSHYAKKECTFYNKGIIPVCPQHKCDMKSHGTHGDITIYRCPEKVYDHLDENWKPTGKRPCSREVWVHKNGLMREVEPQLDLNSRDAKWLINNSFDIIESTKIDNWE